MHRGLTRLCFCCLAAGLLKSAGAQTALTWQEVRAKFEAANPTLQAGQIGVDESRAQEITAYLRPNPTLDCWRIRSIRSPAAAARPVRVSAVGGEHHLLCTSGSTSASCGSRARRKRPTSPCPDQADLERTLLFDLRSAFVQTLQDKAVS